MRKIYLKNIIKINENTIKKLNNKYKYDFKNDKKILTNEGFYKFINNKLYKFNINFKIDTENDICFNINETVRKENIYQIPYDNIEIIIENIYEELGDEIEVLSGDIVLYGNPRDAVKRQLEKENPQLKKVSR